jgi:hypothetical protein
VAVTVNVYEVPLERPVIVIGELAPVAVNPPMLEVTVYLIIDEPPSDEGALNEIVASPFPRTAVTPVGDPGVEAGVIEFDGVELALVPTLFFAVTVNVYEVPLERPVIMIGELPPVATNPPIFDATVYVVIVLPPFETGGVNEIIA